MADTLYFNAEADPAHPGWFKWELRDKKRFNEQALGKLILRRDEDGKARLRMFPTIAHSNLADRVHGGATLALMDIALFAAAKVFGVQSVGLAVTIDLTSQFIGSAVLDMPLDAVVERLRETGRMVFMRGLVVQGDELIASFSGTIRKSSPPRA